VPAVVFVLGPGPTARLICEECSVVALFARTKPAQKAAGLHNREQHPTEEEPS
jgi:hypothetical protein